VTAARIVVRGATTALTRRTVVRKAFLGPWHPLVDQCWLYALADAQRLTSMAVHHGVRVVNHHHLSVTPSEPNTAEFLRRFHSDVSGSLRLLLAHERYDVPEALFDSRPTHCMRLLDAEAQASHLLYERLNPVAAGLVASPEYMPSVKLDFMRWKGDGLVIKRPPLYFANNRPEELRLDLTPPPLLYRAYGGDLQTLIWDLDQLTQHGVKALKQARGGRPFMGAQKLRRLHPWNEPVSLAERSGHAVPCFKLGAGDWLGRDPNRKAKDEVRAWLGGYGGSLAQHGAQVFRRQQRGAGEPWDEEDVVFPHGTYEMRVRHHVPIAPPDADALVSAPGPLLDEVKDELEQDEALRGGVTAERQALKGHVRATCDAEVSDFAQHEQMPFHGAGKRPPVAPETSETTSSVGPDRPEAQVRPRLDQGSTKGKAPKRVITLRDQRTGRPRKPIGSDPPC
jgi:hypothetical protein